MVFQEGFLSACAISTFWRMGAARYVLKGAGMRALVVDDSSSVRAILKRILCEPGFEVTTVSNGSDALAMMAQLDLDLVLIDWNIPGMKGFDLLREIRRQSRYEQVKVVMVTTEANEADMSHALVAGANEYIMKPFTPDVVYDKLRLVGLPVPHGEEVVCA
jgi:two-component system chemotaxis response regulator CheY